MYLMFNLFNLFNPCLKCLVAKVIDYTNFIRIRFRCYKTFDIELTLDKLVKLNL